MEKTPFILHEKFRSDNHEQRKDALSNTVPSKSCA